MNKLSGSLTQRVNSHRLPALFLLVVLLVGIGYWWLREAPGPKEPTFKQEFTQLDVVQYYLHMPSGDVIIGRKNANFDQFSKVATNAILGINGAAASNKIPEADLTNSDSASESNKEKGKAGADFDANSVESIQEIERKYISITLWLPQAQKISTKITKNPTPPVDKYGNQVITTDRVLLVLAGPYKGMILTRDDATTGTWTAWDTENPSVQQLVELVRKGGI